MTTSASDETYPLTIVNRSIDVLSALECIKILVRVFQQFAIDYPNAFCIRTAVTESEPPYIESGIFNSASVKFVNDDSFATTLSCEMQAYLPTVTFGRFPNLRIDDEFYRISIEMYKTRLEGLVKKVLEYVRSVILNCCGNKPPTAEALETIQQGFTKKLDSVVLSAKTFLKDALVTLQEERESSAARQQARKGFIGLMADLQLEKYLKGSPS